ncbi:hypothetical protein HII28_17025 [Planctomonas sp. JC2975]|uniref:hypothetical protein n=1 Tax=Planctomonas sp. JC2975 TaxID=2729626 RepID=UPI0014761C6E|nr:hypothetical protein [Planctomonas sp. JC2975]NNC13573.1 hypothetical protein [Planctomonas sp. JC2975]
MTTMPWFFFVLVAVPVLGIPAVTLRIVYRRARAAGTSRRSATTTVVVSALVALAWMSVLWWASASGVLSRMTLLMPAAVTVWLLVVLLWSRVSAVASALRAPDAASALIAPQVLRVAGIIFVLAMLIGRLPWLFALPAGLGDIAVGIAAPFVMRAVERGRYRRAVWFNVFGLLDLVVALALGALTGLSAATQVIPVVPSSAELTQLPLVLIPTTAVPLAIALHVFDLVAIRRRVRSASAVPKVGTLESV